MKKIFAILGAFFFLLNVEAQNFKSIHQQQLEFYNKFNTASAEFWKKYFNHKKIEFSAEKGCQLNKIVFGWHPYWVNGLEDNYQWCLLSDLAYFAYEVDPSTGDAVSTHGWETAAVVETAKQNGVRVHLTATLFGQHDEFFGNATAVQNLIDNLITEVIARDADGINIDFEGMGSDNRDQFTQFIADLKTQMQQQDPNLILSVCLYAVDWSGVFDIQSLNQYVDFYTIMGYDYYYSGSSQAGPTGQLYTLASFDYNQSRSITYYKSQGAPNEKLVLGVPYYGFDWPTESSSIPSNTTGSSSVVFYKDFKSNYGAPILEENSLSTVRVYYSSSSGSWRQAWVDNEIAMAYKYKMVLQQDIAGIAIWALGYDDGYTQLWDLIKNYFSNYRQYPKKDTIWDLGGPNHNYYNKENFVQVLYNPNAVNLTLNFTDFSLEANYDSLYIYDGNSVNSPLIGGFSGSTSPGLITASSNALTLKFTSDGATTYAGWTAIVDYNLDFDKPTTNISAPQWNKQDFYADFQDNDNVQVKYAFYQVLDRKFYPWRANNQFGYLYDDFDSSQLSSEWNIVSGNWYVENGYLRQDDESLSNTNIYIDLGQDTSEIYLYSWDMRISGSGTNRRAGFHFFTDDPTQDNRHNSYMVYLRVDGNLAQIYKYIDNTYYLMANEPCQVNENQWYNYKVLFIPKDGAIFLFQNDTLVASWLDCTPWTFGGYLSLRTGNCIADYDNIKVFKGRLNSALVSIGENKEIRVQNPEPNSPAAKITSIVCDNNFNFSAENQFLVNIDTTAPQAPDFVNDGIDIDLDTTNSNSQLSANWAEATDPNSFITKYWFAIGTQPYSDDVYAWTSTTSTHVSITDLSLQYGQTYYFTVKAENSVGLLSAEVCSDGITVVQAAQPPIAQFTVSDSLICSGDSINFVANTENVNEFYWFFEGGDIQTSNIPNPTVVYPQAGDFSVKLKVCNDLGCDSTEKFISVKQNVEIDFEASPLQGQAPLTVSFSNNSQFAENYLWLFGDGYQSQDENPSHIYYISGIYDVSLIANNEFCSDTLTKSQYITVLEPSAVDGLELSIYPNPTKDKILLKNISSPCKCSIFTENGKQIKTVKNSQIIDVSTLESGIYILEIQTSQSKVFLFKIQKL